MKHQTRTILQKICILAGVGLVLTAGAIMVYWQWSIHTSAQHSRDCVQALGTLIPEVQNAALEERQDNTMAVMGLDGTDYVGILEFPLCDSVLPVCGDWGNPVRSPRRLGGSIYDGTIQIGATSQRGQYDFFRQISVGDQIFFTDMEGNRYALTVSDLRYAKHADQTILNRSDAQMTLFIKNIYAFEYLIVSCDVPR